jgi:hypothetical protein
MFSRLFFRSSFAFAVVLLLGLLAAVPASAQGAPIGGCPPSFQLVTVAFLLEHAPGLANDPSIDVNGDKQTCIHLIDVGGIRNNEKGLRVAAVDNHFP